MILNSLALAAQPDFVVLEGFTRLIEHSFHFTLLWPSGAESSVHHERGGEQFFESFFRNRQGLGLEIHFLTHHRKDQLGLRVGEIFGFDVVFPGKVDNTTGKGVTNAKRDLGVALKPFGQLHGGGPVVFDLLQGAQRVDFESFKHGIRAFEHGDGLGEEIEFQGGLLVVGHATRHIVVPKHDGHTQADLC